MADQRKRHNESDIQAKETPEQEHENRKKQKKFEATMEPWELKEGMYLKKQKKKIAELSKRLKEMCELVKKLEKKSDIRENSLKGWRCVTMARDKTMYTLGLFSLVTLRMVSVPEEPFDNIALINFYASKEGHEVKSTLKAYCGI